MKKIGVLLLGLALLFVLSSCQSKNEYSALDESEQNSPATSAPVASPTPVKSPNPVSLPTTSPTLTPALTPASMPEYGSLGHSAKPTPTPESTQTPAPSKPKIENNISYPSTAEIEVESGLVIEASQHVYSQTWIGFNIINLKKAPISQVLIKANNLDDCSIRTDDAGMINLSFSNNGWVYTDTLQTREIGTASLSIIPHKVGMHLITFKLLKPDGTFFKNQDGKDAETTVKFMVVN